MKVLIYEHACGGGFAEGVVSPGLLAEGFGMLHSCVSGLKAAGHEVLVVLDEGLSRFNPPVEADYVVPIFSFKEAQQAILKACVDIDAAYVIAPETGGTLHALVEFIEQQGVPLLNSRPSAIRAVSDKMNLYKTLETNGLRTPKTVQVDVDKCVKGLSFLDEFGFPVVFKPVDGVGCSGLSVVRDVSQVEAAVGKIVAELGSEVFVVQEYLEGEAVSVSLLCTDSRAVGVSFNRQNVALSSSDGVSCYMGGVVPFCSEWEQEAFRVAEAVVGCFLGLRGYVGVDMILTDMGPVVIDVNPRLTTSFVGLSRVAGFNVADAIVDAALKYSLPVKSVLRGCACFSKLETFKVDVDVLDKLYEVSEVVSPPFSVQDSQTSCALISAEGASLDEAYCRLEAAKRHVLGICGGVGSFG